MPRENDQFFNAIQNRPWALHPDKLEEISVFIDMRLAGEKVEFPETASGNSGNRAEDSYEVRQGVAILPVYGILDKRMNLLMRFSGGTSTELLARDFLKAQEDPRVEAILLDIDSPGGSIDGTKELADLIFASRGAKPLVAYANGLMASAAYWIGSAADRLVAVDTAQVGSIGVALMHYDYSGQDAKLGIKRTAIAGGKYKRIASDEKPLSQEGEAYLQGIVDDYYRLFIEAVARQRGVDPETVEERMADGRLFIGKKARRAGLVDQIGNLDSALALARKMGGTMDIKTLQEKHPDLYQQVKEEGAAAVTLQTVMEREPQAAEQLRKEGADRERVRVLKILHAEGDPQVTMEAIEQGTAPEAAFEKFFQAEKARRGKDLKDLVTQAPNPLGQTTSQESTQGDFMAKVQELLDKKEAKTRGEAIKLAAARHPELHEQWLEGQKTKK